MLGLVVFVSLIVFAVILPIISIKKYYKPTSYGILGNIFGIIVTLITWPIIPIRFAWRASDGKLIAWYWISFIVFMVSFVYWVVVNVDSLVQTLSLQQQL